MNYDLINVGNTKKAVGFDGSIRVEVQEEYLNDLLSAEAVFVEYGYEILPFFPDKIENNNTLIIRFDELTDKESVTKIAGKEIYLRKSEISDVEVEILNEEYDLDEWVGYMVEEEEKGTIGEIIAIEEYPQQVMLIVQASNKQILIPFHQELITKILEDKIIMDLPEGLFDL